MSNEMALWAEIKALRQHLEDLKASIEVPGRWVYLQTPKTSTAWNGNARSTMAKTLIDLSSVFGVPDKIKSILAYIALRDSGSAGGQYYFILSPVVSAFVGPMTVVAPRTTNDEFIWANQVVPCDTNGDVYFQNAASGVNTMDVTLQIWAYQR